VADLLVLDRVSAGYEESVTLDDVSLQVGEGDSVALLGRNGVGKTTLLVTIMGFTRLHQGDIHWKGRSISALPVYKRVHAGLGWVPQERLVFPSLTVEEHLTSVARAGYWDLARVYELLPRLRERRRHAGNHLSGGEQQMVAIGRALMVNPQLLLLDEPLEGLAPLLMEELSVVITALVSSGQMAIMLVEQHANAALRIAKRAIVLNRGKIVHQSDSDSLRADANRLQSLLAVA
jgi:branched-chain amino acid transport system ATP-binding protein